MPRASHPAQRRARVADQHARHRRGRRARASPAPCRRRSPPRCRAGRRSRRSARRARRRSRRSSRPAWTVRIAPAVKAELPPDHSARRLLQDQHRAPLSRAAWAAHRPALPAPTTITSASIPRAPLPGITGALPRRCRAAEDARHAVERTTAQPHRRVAHRAPGALVLRRPPAGRARHRRRLRRAAPAGLRAAGVGVGRDRGADRRPRTGDAARPAAGRPDRPARPPALRDRRRADRRARLRRAGLRPRRGPAARAGPGRRPRQRAAAPRDLRAAARGRRPPRP